MSTNLGFDTQLGVLGGLSGNASMYASGLTSLSGHLLGSDTTPFSSCATFDTGTQAGVGSSFGNVPILNASGDLPSSIFTSATETDLGIAEMASDQDLMDGVSGSVVSPSSMDNVDASETTIGFVRKATSTEIEQMSDVNAAVTLDNLLTAYPSPPQITDNVISVNYGYRDINPRSTPYVLFPLGINIYDVDHIMFVISWGGANGWHEGAIIDGDIFRETATLGTDYNHALCNYFGYGSLIISGEDVTMSNPPGGVSQQASFEDFYTDNRDLVISTYRLFYPAMADFFTGVPTGAAWMDYHTSVEWADPLFPSTTNPGGVWFWATATNNAGSQFWNNRLDLPAIDGGVGPSLHSIRFYMN